MNNISSNGRIALRAVQNDPPAEKLTRCKKIIVPLESNPPNETSDRIVEDLRRVLRTVQKAKNATSEEIALAGDLLLRVKALGIRREEFRTAKNGNEGTEEVSLEELENTNRRSGTPDPAKYERPVASKPKREPDGFIRGFVNPEEAIARCSVAGFTPNTPTINNPDKILQIALGDIPLDEKSVDQLWLTWSYAFKEKWNKTLSPMARKIQTAILHYANPRGFLLHIPDVFTFAESLEFLE
jgi:hypothetical protein